MMHVVLLGAGLTIVVMGLVLTGWAALDIAAGTDRSLLFAAMVALVGGLILVALAAILSRLRRLGEVIENWPVPRGAAAQALKRAVAGVPAGGAAAPRIAPLRPPHGTAAPQSGPGQDFPPPPFADVADTAAHPPAVELRAPRPDFALSPTPAAPMPLALAPSVPAPSAPAPPPRPVQRPGIGDLVADPAMHVASDGAQLPAQAEGFGGAADNPAPSSPVLPPAASRWSATTEDLPHTSDVPYSDVPNSDVPHSDVPHVAAPQVAAWPRIDAADRIDLPEPSAASAVPLTQPTTDALGPAAETATSRPPNARTTWPELRAGERLAGPPLAPARSSEAAQDAAPDSAPEVAIRSAGPTIIKSGVIEGMAYTIYSDGSIEADLPEGLMRFASIAEWRAHMRMGS